MQTRRGAFCSGGGPAVGGGTGYWLFTAAWLAAGLGCLGQGAWKEQCGREPGLCLQERINPNTATVGSLVRLEGVGPVRAHAIVDYRQAHAADGRRVFAGPGDLEAVHGIGPKTVEKMSPYLDFGEPGDFAEQEE